ncbi:MAG: tetratricopeptide repeat protein [Desulfomonilaceae bacterium]
MRSSFVLRGLVVFSSLTIAGDGFEGGQAACERREYAKSFEMLLPLAKRGNANAQNIVARMYALGQGVQKDESEAMKWMALSAGNGNLEAREALAALAIMEFYEMRQGVENKEEEIKWIVSFAERGNPEAMNMLGMPYSSGNGLPMTTLEAEKWYCRAIKNEHQQAARKPGLMMAGILYYLERVKKTGDKIDRPPC